MTPSLSGLRLVTSDLMVEQFRFPKTKKRRIRNKWAKRPENWRPMRRAMIMGDMVLVHPSLAAPIWAATPENLTCSFSWKNS